MDVAILVFTCAVNLLLGFFVLSQDPKVGYARAFTVSSVLLCIWITANYFTNSTDLTLQFIDTANKISYVAGFGAIVAGLVFTHYFPVRRTINRFQLILTVTFATLVALFSATTLVAGRVDLINGVVTFGVGRYLWVYIAGSALTLGLVIRNLIQPMRKSNPAYQAQARLILIAFIVSPVLAILLNIVIPSLGGGWTATKYGPLATLVLVVVIMYAIVKHGLFDIRLAVVRTLAYILSLGTLATVYFLLAYGASTLIFGTQSSFWAEGPFNTFLALVLAFLFQPIRDFFNHLTNRFFYRERYNAEEFFGLLSNVLSATVDLKDLLTNASDVIQMTFKSKQAFFFMKLGEHHKIVAGGEHHSALTLEDISHIEPLALKQKGRVISADNVQQHRLIYSILMKRGVSLLLPLWHENKIIGYLALGEALGTRYNSRDLKVLEAIADELVIAIQNALSLEEVREVNSSLQDRIDTATHSLRLTNDKLRRLDDTKDEFISMASHQLRTPLTSVKGYISMILDGDAGPVNAQQRKFLTEAFESSNRMAGIIGDFLNVSRLQTGKFGLEREDVDLSEIVAKEVTHLQNTASVHGLVLQYHKPSRFPTMHLDKSKIEQVIMNFIDNAIFYAPNTGTVDIELFVRAGRAVFTVRDHGIGVPKEERASLFTKFFRATNARRKRPDGTGVGLFLAKKVIVAHKGAVIFESVEGKGSTFGFEIPLVAEAHAA